MSNIMDISNEFKDIAELRAYANAQYNTIINLTKKVNKLEEEKLSLERQVNSRAQVIDTDEVGSLILATSDEETICRIQLKKLKDKSLNSEELTLEETKRVEIYTKLLISMKEKSVKKEDAPSRIDDATLLASLTLITNDSIK